VARRSGMLRASLQREGNWKARKGNYSKRGCNDLPLGTLGRNDRSLKKTSGQQKSANQFRIRRRRAEGSKRGVSERRSRQRRGRERGGGKKRLYSEWRSQHESFTEKKIQMRKSG